MPTVDLRTARGSKRDALDLSQKDVSTTVAWSRPWSHTDKKQPYTTPWAPPAA